MGSKAKTGFSVLLLVASILQGFTGFASAQPTEVVAGGELEYQHSCAFATVLRGGAMAS